jgi:hypothetical protein
MDSSQIILVVLLVLLFAGVAFYLLHQRTQPRWPIPHARRSELDRSVGSQSEIQRDFSRVFSMVSVQGREGLIKRWMDRSGCDRTEAMRLAIDEWRRDNR